MPSEQAPLDTLQRLIKAGIAQLNIGCFATVISYDAATQSCTAQPIVKTEFQNSPAMQPPPIHKVPVKWFSAGGFSITAGLQPGDHVWLDFCDRDTSGWLLLAKDPTRAGDRKRRFSINDAVATPCGRPFVKPVRAPIDTIPINVVAGAPTPLTPPYGPYTQDEQAPDTNALVVAQDKYVDGVPATTHYMAVRLHDDGIRIGTDANCDLLNILQDMMDAIYPAIAAVPAVGTAAAAALVLCQARLDVIRRP